MSSTRPARNSTPLSFAGSGRRSTRAARPSTGSRRGRGRGRRGESDASFRIKANREPARKYCKVLRPPAAGVKFFIPTWVPIEKLTPEERDEYLRDQDGKAERVEPEQGKPQALDVNSEQTMNLNSKSISTDQLTNSATENPNQIQVDTSTAPLGESVVPNREAQAPESLTNNANSEESSERPTKRVKYDMPEDGDNHKAQSTDTGVSSALEDDATTKAAGVPSIEDNTSSLRNNIDDSSDPATFSGQQLQNQQSSVTEHGSANLRTETSKEEVSDI